MRVYCPYCKKEVEYKIEKRDVKEFRGIEINTYENVAVCKECHQDLYVNEIEEKNNERIYELYREKANIIKPQDIVDLRKKYDISQRELTAILGFGKMTINRYERGGVPTKSQSDYIKLLIDNDNKFVEKVKEAYKNGNINDKTYEKIVSTNLENEIEKNDIKYYASLVGCVCILAFIVNNIFDSNLMFISKNFPGTPIEIIYKYTGRLFTLVMSVGQMTLPFYCVYEVIKIRKEAKRREQ